MTDQTETARYRKKPIPVEARQLLGSDDGQIGYDLAAWCGGSVGGTFREPRVLVPTLEGDLTARAGDWIVKGCRGEFWPVRGDVFAETYEPAGQAPATKAASAPDECSGCRYVPCGNCPPTDWIDGHPQLEAIAAAVWEQCGRSDSGTCVEDDPRNIAVAALAAALPATTDRATEAHRLALSEALGLGTGAPWDAIHDRATELGLPPLDQDPVARRLGLLAEYRAAVLREAADAIDAGTRQAKADEVLEPDKYRPCRDASAQLRRMAAEAGPADTVGQDDGETSGCDVEFEGGGQCTKAAGHRTLQNQDPHTPPVGEVVHGCPPDGSGLTPCCGRTPFELPLTDRISSEAPVTCPGPEQPTT